MLTRFSSLVLGAAGFFFGLWFGCASAHAFAAAPEVLTVEEAAQRVGVVVPFEGEVDQQLKATRGKFFRDTGLEWEICRAGFERLRHQWNPDVTR